MDSFSIGLLVALAVLVASAPALLALLRVARLAFRLAADARRGRGKMRDVLELAIRTRLLVRHAGRPDYKPQFWMGAEYDAMPERRLFEICAAYQNLRLAGLRHDAVIERLEIWRSRFGAANLSRRHASIDDYLRYRAAAEFPGLEPWPAFLVRLQRRLFFWHNRIRSERQQQSLDEMRPSLRRRLYTVLISGADLALDDSTQIIPIGWTDLEKYLESDSCAVRVLEGDEIWSYSAARSAGLALVRNGRIIELSELADFGSRTPRRRRSGPR